MQNHTTKIKYNLPIEVLVKESVERVNGGAC